MGECEREDGGLLVCNAPDIDTDQLVNIVAKLGSGDIAEPPATSQSLCHVPFPPALLSWC